MKKHIRKTSNISGTKKCDICGIETFLEIHHINGRKIDNYNDDFNLTDICPNCHSEVHNGLKIIEKWIMSTTGRLLLWHYKHDESISNMDAKPYLITKHHN